MAKGENQRAKMLYVYQILKEYTDENHGLSATDIIKKLEAEGINAERKSVYRDIEELQRFGVEIECKKENPKGYYIIEREFDLPELKILVDLVSSSKFLTQTRTTQLIHKLQGFASCYEGKKLERQAALAGRLKTPNKEIYSNVDRIYVAMEENKMISFEYCTWDINKVMVPNGKGPVKISPFRLCWDDENYYLIAFDHKTEYIKHYRVDKMKNVQMGKEIREGTELFDHNFKLAEYLKPMFSMFAGEKECVNIVFDKSLVGIMIDRFGKDVTMRVEKDNPDQLNIRVNIETSKPFYGWLAMLSDKAYIKEPQKVREEFIEYIDKIREQYS